MRQPGFKDMVKEDIHHVFLDTNAFAERRTVAYDGDCYRDIPILLLGLEERERRQLTKDHAQGLYQVSAVLHCDPKDLGGKQPEEGTRIRINDREGAGGFFRDFYVVSSCCEAGMLQVELEAIDE